MLQLIPRFHKLSRIIQKGQSCSSQMASLLSQNEVSTESAPSNLSLVMQHPVTVSVLLHSAPFWYFQQKNLYDHPLDVYKNHCTKQRNCIPFQPSEVTPPCFFTEHSEYLPIVAHSLKQQTLVITLLFKTRI